jgi:hypothetical protein
MTPTQFISAVKYLKWDFGTDLALALIVLTLTVFAVIFLFRHFEHSLNEHDREIGQPVITVVGFVIICICLWIVFRCIPRLVVPEGYLFLKLK